MAVVIHQALLDALLAEAAASPEREVCGLLFGAPDRIERSLPTPNRAADPATAFEVDPAALLAAHRAERAGGARLIGCYHSHPRGLPVPSARDRAAAEPGRLWLIIGGGEARAWRATADGFVPLVIAVA